MKRTARQTINLVASGLASRGPITAPERVCLWEPGPIVGDFGVNVWDAEAARAVMGAYIERAAGDESRAFIPLDIEHATNLQANPGYDPARPPPGGGYAALKLDPRGALWLDPIRWSDYARTEIESGSRCAISPDWDYDPKTGRPVRLKKVALVQNPGTYGIGLMASATNGAKKIMIDPIVMAALKAALTAEDPKTSIEALIAQLEAADGAGGPSSTEMGGQMPDQELAAGMNDEQKALCKATASALLEQLGRKPKPAIASAPSAPRAPVVDMDAVRREARAAGVQAFREQTQIASLIASVGASPGYTPALASELQGLPLAMVKRIVGALPPPPAAAQQEGQSSTQGATAGAQQGVKTAPLAGAEKDKEQTQLSAAEQVSIDAINRAAKSGAERIAEARAAAGTNGTGAKISEDGSATFSAFAQMGRKSQVAGKAN